MYRLRFRIFFIALALVAIGIFAVVENHSSYRKLQTISLLPNEKAVPEVALDVAPGMDNVSNYFRGHWTLVFFGFTSCPDYCPMELRTMTKMMHLLGDKPELQVLFISIDPEHDGAQQLSDYVSSFQANIKGVSGSPRELTKLTRFFGAAFERNSTIEKLDTDVKVDKNDAVNYAKNYGFTHSLRPFIVNPQGNYIGSFVPPYDAELMSVDMKALMR